MKPPEQRSAVEALASLKNSERKRYHDEHEGWTCVPLTEAANNIAALVPATEPAAPDTERCGTCGHIHRGICREHVGGPGYSACRCYGSAAAPDTERVPPARVSDKRLTELWDWAKKHAMLRDQGGLPATVLDAIEELRSLRAAQAGPPPLNASDPIAQAKFVLHRLARTTEDARIINRTVNALVTRLSRTGEPSDE